MPYQVPRVCRIETTSAQQLPGGQLGRGGSAAAVGRGRGRNPQLAGNRHLRRHLLLAVAAMLLGLAPSLATAQGSPSGNTFFFGQTFPGDAFVWCIDVSGSMATNNRLDIGRSEIILALDLLDPSQEFNLIAYNTIVGQFSLTPVAATQSNKAEAIEWLGLLDPVSTTCMTSSIVVSLEQLQLTNNSDRTMFLIGDGPPACIGENATSVAAATTAANDFSAPIHCFLMADTPEGVDLFSTIAAQNDGVFRNIEGVQGDVFLRGDADGDGNFIGLLDAIFILNYQFVAGSPEPSCFDAADADDDGSIIGLLDALYLLNFQFVSGSPTVPAPGTQNCGIDPSVDPLECAVSVCP